MTMLLILAWVLVLGGAVANIYVVRRAIRERDAALRLVERLRQRLPKDVPWD